MEIRVLKYFITVAKTGTMTRAAERLHITQPTLSRQIMEMEEELETRLFVRGKRQVQLTDSGLLFLRRAEEIVRLAEKAGREMKEQNTLVGGVVSVACVESAASVLLARLLTEFRGEHPKVRYELYSADGNDIREKIDRGDIDLGVLIEPVEAAKYDFIRLPVYETWGVMMRSDDELAARAALTTEDVAKLPLIVPRRSIVIDEIANWLGVDSGALNIVAAHNLLTNSLLLVKSGFGYTICVQGAYDIRETPSLSFRPFSPKRTTGHVLVWKKNHAFSSATSKFLDFVKIKYDAGTC